MRLLEYEAKALLRRYNVALPLSEQITSPGQSISLPLPLVLKVQVPVGGRGKAGGVVPVTSPEAYAATVSALFKKQIHGHQVNSLLAEEVLPIATELYLALLVDRDARSIILLAHKQGGVEVESAHNFWRLPLGEPPNHTQLHALRKYFGLPSDQQVILEKLLGQLWKVCTDDALLVEINPLVFTTDRRLVCADAKIQLDPAAMFRHPEWQFEEKAHSAQFVTLDTHGTIASMANGAGLAMATIDAIKAAGAVPANFFDVGGGTSTEGMAAAFAQIYELRHVQAIVVNIFAGITRCDQVAAAVVAARERFPNLPPLFIRLAGTNEAEGRRILAAENIPMLDTLEACITQAVKVVSHA